MTEKMSPDNLNNYPAQPGAASFDAFAKYKEQLSIQRFNDCMSMSIQDLFMKKEKLEMELDLYESTQNREMLDLVTDAIAVKERLDEEERREQSARQQAIERARNNLAILESDAVTGIIPRMNITKPVVAEADASEQAGDMEQSEEIDIPHLYYGNKSDGSEPIADLSALNQKERRDWIARYVAGEYSELEEQQEDEHQAGVLPREEESSIRETGASSATDHIADSEPGTSLFSGVSLTPTLTPKKRAASRGTSRISSVDFRRLIPKTRKMRVGAVAAAVLVTGGVTWATTEGSHVGIVAECSDDVYSGDPVATTAFDAQSDIEWSLTNREDGPPIRVSDDGKELPKLTLENVSIDLNVCSVDGEGVSETDDAVVVDASSLVTRAVIDGSEASSVWQRIDRELLEGAAAAGILTTSEAAGYIKSMESADNVTAAAELTTNALAIQIEDDKSAIEKDTTVRATLVDLAIKGLEQRASAAEKKLIVNGDVANASIEFADATEDQDMQIEFEDSKTKIEVSAVKMTKLHADTIDEKKDDTKGEKEK